jgi:hypothetical protein
MSSVVTGVVTGTTVPSPVTMGPFFQLKPWSITFPAVNQDAQERYLPMARKRNGLVSGYARMWPREIFDKKDGPELIARKLDFLQQKGVYILYRDEEPHYIGQTSGPLFRRIRSHATRPQARYYNFWNLFSAFAVADQKGRDELEGILIAAMPTANSSQPKLNKLRMPKQVARLMRQMRQERVRFK